MVGPNLVHKKILTLFLDPKFKDVLIFLAYYDEDPRVENYVNPKVRVEWHDLFPTPTERVLGQNLKIISHAKKFSCPDQG